MHKLSVIINSYQGNQAHLDAAIKSILAQAEVDVECIVSTVVGDRAISTAETNGALVVKNEEPDIYAQLNRALKSVSGDWFFYFSGNDVAFPQKAINEIGQCLAAGKEICFSAFYKTDPGLESRNLVEFHEYDLAQHYRANFVSDVALVSRRLLDRYGPFDHQLGNAAYWDFWLRIAETEGNVFCYNRNPEWLYRIEPTSRHVLRQHNVDRMIQNCRDKLAMLEKRADSLARFGLTGEIQKFEKKIRDLQKAEKAGIDLNDTRN